ncbi:MAG: cell division protein ZapA [Pseudomonadales bacterium]|nr:cell division protein ZapA [Pseudomonadales bacterium]
MLDAETVSVSILDKEYQVNCPADEIAALKQSAQYLDNKMRDVKNSASVLGLDRIAVMAALNIANDLINEQQKTARMIQDQENEIQNLSNKLDTALNRLNDETD